MEEIMEAALDVERRVLWLDGRECRLSPILISLVAVMASRPAGVPVSISEFSLAVGWNPIDRVTVANYLRGHIKRLRDRTYFGLVENRWGGYALTCPVEVVKYAKASLRAEAL